MKKLFGFSKSFENDAGILRTLLLEYLESRLMEIIRSIIISMFCYCNPQSDFWREQLQEIRLKRTTKSKLRGPTDSLTYPSIMEHIETSGQSKYELLLLHLLMYFAFHF